MTTSVAPPQPAAPSIGTASKSIRALQAAGVVGGLAQSLSGAAGALLAREVGGSDAVAGLPQSLLVAGSAVAALALSALTRRVGRRMALAAGLVTALGGGAITIGGAVLAALPLVLAGSLLLGAGNTVVMLSRYAAADLVSQEARGRAMGAVLAATTIGAVAGPNLLAPAGALARALGITTLAGPYAVAAAGFAVSVAIILIGMGPDRPARQQTTAQRRPVALDRNGAAGLGVLTVANLVMVGVMTMAPVHLHHSGSGLGLIGLVVSLHIAGMFAPSPVSGWLTDRVGPQRAAAGSGLVLIVATVAAAVWADDTVVLSAALVLLGIGWNLALLSGSALLTAGVPDHERPRREGWGEVGMGVAAAGAGVAAGPVMVGGGYPLVAVAGAVAAAIILPIAGWRRGVVASRGGEG